MFIYSKNIIRFINEIKCVITDVLSREVGLEVKRDRFYDRYKFNSYPIKVEIYNNKRMLGYFDSEFYELGFHESLLHANREQLRNVIRHELAHYVMFITYGKAFDPHGAEFRQLCQQMRWGEEVYRATFYLDKEANVAGLEESNILRKVQKLMALATSSNENEAEQAMIKSQQLLLKHNIEFRDLGESIDEDRVILKRIMKQPKENAKMRSIARVLETFFVSVVIHRSDEFTYLEILGKSVNVEIAEYVAKVLEAELDKLWNKAQKEANLKGMVAKNSFFLGISKGYCIKIEALKRSHRTEEKNALLIIEKQLVDAKEMVYKRLTSSRSNGRYCPESSALGEKMGKQLSINPAINRNGKNSDLMLTYSS